MSEVETNISSHESPLINRDSSFAFISFFCELMWFCEKKIDLPLITPLKKFFFKFQLLQYSAAEPPPSVAMITSTQIYTKCEFESLLGGNTYQHPSLQNIIIKLVFERIKDLVLAVKLPPRKNFVLKIEVRQIIENKFLWFQ